MDPLSGASSVLAVATAALQSAKVLYELVDGLVDAPRSVAQSKQLLAQTQTTLSALTRTLETDSASGTIASVLKEIGLSQALESTTSFCQASTVAMTKFTSRSTDSHFSRRDRFVVYFNKSKIDTLNKDLADFQRTITMVLSSITLIVSSRTSGNIDQLRTQFDTQEQALVCLDAQLSTRREAEPPASDSGTGPEGQPSAQLTASLQQVCQRTLSATRARRAVQEFGDMKTDSHSIAMQGIVGLAQPGVEQSFGNLTTTMGSRAFQGQMDSGSFQKLFSK